uniref:Uncharacterized protein n=1 Tax=Arundo donax TaxID=35708 RepID=A0A0A9HVG5_ARUDO
MAEATENHDHRWSLDLQTWRVDGVCIVLRIYGVHVHSRSVTCGLHLKPPMTKHLPTAPCRPESHATPRCGSFFASATARK